MNRREKAICQSPPGTRYWRPAGRIGCLPTHFSGVFVKSLLPVRLLCGLFSLLPVSALAEEVACHYTYGGETKTLRAAPVESPYAVSGIKVGSFFHFRVVFQTQPADTAALKVYTYADRDDGPVLIHQATFPYPPRVLAGQTPPAAYGLTGLHFVYEATRDGELQYWCELQASAKTTGRRPQ